MGGVFIVGGGRYAEPFDRHPGQAGLNGRPIEFRRNPLELLAPKGYRRRNPMATLNLG
jgi:hypothetical protein